VTFLRFRDGLGYLYVLDPRRGRARRLTEQAVAWVAYGSTSVLTSPPEWQPLPR
jgi:hypothetical protein